MTARWVRTVFVALIVAGVAAPALAENWLCEFFEGVVRDTKRRQCWPKPFTCPDREAVRAPFAVMVANGWQRQNMLADFHFEPGTTRLTEAGRLKVRSIVFDSPEQHRTVFVRRADTPEETTRAHRVGAATRGDHGPARPSALGDAHRHVGRRLVG